MLFKFRYVTVLTYWIEYLLLVIMIILLNSFLVFISIGLIGYIIFVLSDISQCLDGFVQFVDRVLVFMY